MSIRLLALMLCALLLGACASLSPLSNALKNEPGKVDALLEKKEGINADEGKGWTPLLYAARYRPQYVEKLLAYGARVDAKTADGWTALLLAARYQPEAVVPLLKAGADVNAVTKHGYSALLLAAGFQPECLPELIKAGAYLDQVSHAQSGTSQTALSYAIKKKDMKSILLLLESGASLLAAASNLSPDFYLKKVYPEKADFLLDVVAVGVEKASRNEEERLATKRAQEIEAARIAELNRKRAEAEAQAMREKQRILSGFIAANPALSASKNSIVEAGAHCKSFQSVKSRIRKEACEGMTSGRIREYFKPSPQCTALKQKLADAANRDSRETCAAYETALKDFSALFGEQASPVSAMLRDAVSSRGSKRLDAYDSGIDAIVDMREAAKRQREQELERSRQQAWAGVMKKVQTMGRTDTAADRIIQQSVRQSQSTIASLARMKSSMNTAVPRTDMAVLKTSLRAVDVKAEAQKTALLEASANERLAAEEEKCKQAGGAFFVDKKSRNFNCNIVSAGKNQVTGVPKPMRADVAANPKNQASGQASPAGSATAKTARAASSQAGSSSASAKKTEDMIAVTEARAVCFKRVKAGEKEAWWCVGPVQDTITSDASEQQSLKYAGCPSPRKIIHNVRANYKKFNTADYVHFGYACGKPSMEHDLNVDQLVSVHWPAGANFIRYQCPRNSMNRKKSCVAG